MPPIGSLSLGSLFNTSSGGTPLKARQEYYVGGDVPWLLSGEVAQGEIWAATNFITEAGLKNSSAKIFPKNTVLVAMYGATAGEVGILRVEAATNQAVCGIFPNDKFLPEYLYYVLLSKKDELVGKAAGNAQPNISQAKIRETLVPLTEKAEQSRIVAILDEAFEGIATAKANVEKNLQNAHALFESHLQSVFTQRGPGWLDRTLDQVCIVERGSSPRPIKEYFTTEPDGVNWIKIGDTEEGGKYVYSTGQKITPEGAKQSRFVKEGDFILTNSMSYGRPYIMKTSGYIHDGWFVLRLNMAIDTDYFYYLLSSPVVQLQFASLASGSVVKNISGDLVKKAVLPIPPLEHQHVIVEKLLAISEETQRLAHLYERKLALLAALKKSLLHQAFSGALTAKATDKQLEAVA
jgi:type I restriction enzyme S subunit